MHFCCALAGRGSSSLRSRAPDNFATDMPMNTISHHSALIYVMVVVSAADGAMSAKELRAIGELVKTLPVFSDYDQSRLLPTAQECAQILQEPDGYSAVQGLVKEALPDHLYETAYWLAL